MQQRPTKPSLINEGDCLISNHYYTRQLICAQALLLSVVSMRMMTDTTSVLKLLGSQADFESPDSLYQSRVEVVRMILNEQWGIDRNRVLPVR